MQFFKQQMSKTLNVFFAASRAYLQHFTVAATSLLENNRDLNITISVINSDIPVADQMLVYNFFKEKYNTLTTFIGIGNIDFSIFRTTDLHKKYTYYRLFLADLVPATMDQVLFVDSDIIVTGSLNELAEKQLSDDEFICAVSEVAVQDNVIRLNKLGFPLQSYFNAGVFLANIKLWRRDNLTLKFINIAKKHGHQMEWVDQDILNIYFANNWTMLDKKFNAIHLIRKEDVTPLIIHYNTYSKPWYYVDTHPYNKLYWKYLRLTPFKANKAENFSLKNFILKHGRLFKRELREAGLLSYK
jgi:lipopolysaccharide biosynthesis glycosyltransferase